MEDIYEECPSHDFADGFAAGIILGKNFGSSEDSDGMVPDNEAAWRRMGSPKGGIQGLIIAFVKVATLLWALASIVALVLVAIFGL